MRTLLFILVIITNEPLFCQEMNQPNQQYIDTTSTGKISVNVSPLCLLDLYNGSTYRFGVQFRPMKRLSVGGDGGGYIESISKSLTPFFNISGYHYRIRLSYFPKNLSNFSFGLEYQYKQQKFSYLDSTETESEFKADVSKKVYCYNLFASYDHNFTDRFFIDFQLGLGLRYRDIYNTRSDVVGSTSIVFPWDSMNTGRVTTGQNLLPNITLAVRVGYSLIKN